MHPGHQERARATSIKQKQLGALVWCGVVLSVAAASCPCPCSCERPVRPESLCLLWTLWGRRGQVSLLKLEEDKNQLSKGLDPWSNPNAATASTLHYLLQEKERAQAQEQLQIYHQQGFSSYLQHHHRRQQQSRPGGGDGVSSGESTPVDALATAFGGGRIVRSAAGRKDRHSKVCTARGLRDRRVRLAAHTAIRFYDVQDRLGYDRPSKAVDWLIRNAKAAIDELPAEQRAEGQQPATEAADASTEPAEQVTSTSSYGFGNPGGAIGGVAGSFMPHSVGSADGGVSGSGNVKSLFPSSSTASTTPTQDEYRGSPPDLLSRTTTSHQTQELYLTLQSTNNHQQQHGQIFSHHVSPSHHGMMSGAGVQGWPEHGQRMPSWHAASENSSAGDGRGAAGNGDSYMFGVPPRHQGLDHQGQLFTQGEPLQSSGGWPSARAWLDPLAAIHQAPSTMAGQVGSFSHLVGAGAGGFMGFLAPAAAHQRLQGEEEQGSEAMRE